MFSRRELHQEANRRLRAGDLENAARGWIALIRSAPHDFDARLRLADTLLAKGLAEPAIGVYVCVMRESANAGHPLKAIVVLKVLTMLGHPEVPVLLEALANRYASNSPMLGRGVRLAPPNPDAEVPAAAYLPKEVEDEQLFAAAATVGTSREGLAAYPEKLAPIPLLSELPNDAFVRVLDLVKMVRAPVDQTIVRQGDAGDAFFMLARGSVSVSRESSEQEGAVTLASLGEGSIFGELAILSKEPRGATVSVREDADLLVFTRDSLAAAAESFSALAVALDRFARERLLTNLMATHPLFRPFDRVQRRQLADRFDLKKASPNTVLIREGDPGRGLFLVLTGEVMVTKLDEDRSVEIATLHNGDVFGEISLLDAGNATATVTTTQKTTLLFLERDFFSKLMESVPELGNYFQALADTRTVDTNLTLAAARENTDEEIDISVDEFVMV